MAIVLVMNDDVAVLEAAIEQYGANSVWWYAGFNHRRIAAACGLGADHLIAKQTCTPAEAKKAAEWDEVITTASKGKGKGKAKPKAKGRKKAAPAPEPEPEVAEVKSEEGENDGDDASSND